MLLFERTFERMSKTPKVCRPVRTGVLLEPKYLRFLKSTLEEKIRRELNVSIISSIPQTRFSSQYQEVLLMGPKDREKPSKFEEAKALIQNTVRMTEKNWRQEAQKFSYTKKIKDAQIIILEEKSSVEVLGVDSSSGSNKPINGSPVVEILPGSNKPINGSPVVEILPDGLCPVVMDTQGGSELNKNNFSAPLYLKNKKNVTANRISCGEISLSGINAGPSKSCISELKSPLNSLDQGSEDFILIDSEKPITCKRDPKNETIVLGDETILISSGDEAEDDIQIEEVLERKSFSPQKVKNKKNKRSLSAGRIPIAPSIHPKNLKRRQEDSPTPCQRKSKLSKAFALSDVTSNVSGVKPPTINHSCHSDGKGKKPKKIQSLPACNDSSSGLSVKHAFDNNVITLNNQSGKKTGLRPVIIDAHNVSIESGTKQFHFKKLEICIKYFRDRHHKVIALLPRFRQGFIQGEERVRMLQLENEQILCFTPSRRMADGKTLAAYDDRFIVQTATELGGVIVSNDNFRDIMNENERWKETIENRLLMFTWVGDMLMFPNDPLGRKGPHLEEFLRFPKEDE